jgi:hypothetical protein
MNRRLGWLIISFYFSYLSTRNGAAWAEGRALSLAGDLGLGGVGDVAHLTMQTGVEVREGALAIGLFGRLRLALSQHEHGVVHRRDWDEADDFVHILRHLSYRRTFESKVAMFIAAGEILGFNLGHGSLVRDYANVADPDHLHAGFRLRLRHDRFHLDAMLDNLVRPRVIASRFAVKPSLAAPGLTLGASFVVDPSAPVRIAETEKGARAVDSGFNLESESRVVGHFGVDVEYRIGQAATGDLTPYLDLNGSPFGFGLHLGCMGAVPLERQGRWRFVGQAEYRLGTGGYAPTYVSTFYDLERYQASFNSVLYRQPKAVGLIQQQYGHHGALVQLGLEREALVRLKIGYAYHPGLDAHQLWTRASVHPHRRLDLGLLLMMRGLGAGREAAGVAAMAEARFRILNNLYALGQYRRAWALDPADHYYGVLQSFNLGMGGNWSG